MHTIGIHYVAFLREDRGKDFEWIETHSGTALELFSELKNRFGWPYQDTMFKVAVNDQFCEFHAPLNEGDQVVFIPPVSGGSGV